VLAVEVEELVADSVAAVDFVMVVDLAMGLAAEFVLAAGQEEG